MSNSKKINEKWSKKDYQKSSKRLYSRSDKAMTLIALVITVIILLILAGITINTLSNSGIFEKAKMAKEVSKNAQDYEETQIAKYTNEINSYVSGNRDYTPISYSTEEQDTGIKWINGKTIYQRSLKMASSYTSEVAIDSWDGKSVAGITDVFMASIKPVLDEIIETTMQTNNHTSNSMHYQYPHRLNYSNGYVCAYDNYNVGFINYALYPGTVITIRYTKK